MLELENVCNSALEGNLGSAANQLGCIVSCHLEGACRPDQYAGWTIKLITKSTRAE